MNKPRRFIAGATCPACGLADKLFVYQQDNKNYCQCSRCGALQTMDEDGDISDLSAPPGDEVMQVITILNKK
jgi:uncharacterized metal-binding protein (TIGR02443 family)